MGSGRYIRRCYAQAAARRREDNDAGQQQGGADAPDGAGPRKLGLSPADSRTEDLRGNSELVEWSPKALAPARNDINQPVEKTNHVPISRADNDQLQTSAPSGIAPRVRSQDSGVPIAPEDSTPSAAEACKPTSVEREPMWEHQDFEGLQESMSSDAVEEGSMSNDHSSDLVEELDRTTPNELVSYRHVEHFRESAEWGERVQADPVARSTPKPIHIMGLDTRGKYIAQSLVTSGTPVTLLMHRPLLIQDWHDNGETIRLLREGKVHATSGFRIESSASREDYSQEDPDKPVFKRFGKTLEHTAEPPDTIIDTLIVASHAAFTIPSLSRIAHRLRPSSSICFCGDGLGIIEKVNYAVFPDPDERPTYLMANLSHKLEKGRDFFDVVETETGTMFITKLPQISAKTSQEREFKIQRHNFSWSPNAKYLMGALLHAPELNTLALGHKSFHRRQLMRIAMHALIDPVSVAFEVKSEELLYNYKISQYMKMLLKEISLVIRSLPEVQSLPNIDREFSVEKLEVRANHILRGLGDTYTDFCLEVKAGRHKTGLEFYTGYLLNRAWRLGIECPVMRALELQVEGKQQYYSRLARDYIPFDQTAKRNRPPIVEDDDGKV